MSDVSASTRPNVTTAHRDERVEDNEIVFYEETEARRGVTTTEFWVFIIVVAGLLFFTYESGSDSLSREEGWRYAAFVTVGYLISRGLAKAGSGEPRVRKRDL